MDSNEWKKLYPYGDEAPYLPSYESSSSIATLPSNAPTPRDGAAAAYHKNHIYMFGGSNGH
jgi:hypothetical protein